MTRWRTLAPNHVKFFLPVADLEARVGQEVWMSGALVEPDWDSTGMLSVWVAELVGVVDWHNNSAEMSPESSVEEVMLNECKEEGVSKSAMRVRKGEKMWSDKKTVFSQMCLLSCVFENAVCFFFFPLQSLCKLLRFFEKCALEKTRVFKNAKTLIPPLKK